MVLYHSCVYFSPCRAKNTHRELTMSGKLKPYKY